MDNFNYGDYIYKILADSKDARRKVENMYQTNRTKETIRDFVIVETSLFGEDRNFEIDIRSTIPGLINLY